MVKEPYGSRRGRFAIPGPVLREHPEVVQRVLAETIPVRAEMMLLEDAIEYDAYCLAFEPIAEGEAIPIYDAEYDTVTGSLTWVRRDG
jgi:hypothetical protein